LNVEKNGDQYSLTYFFNAKLAACVERVENRFLVALVATLHGKVGRTHLSPVNLNLLLRRDLRKSDRGLCTRRGGEEGVV
jgi:hypothetical protein